MDGLCNRLAPDSTVIRNPHGHESRWLSQKSRIRHQLHFARVRWMRCTAAQSDASPQTLFTSGHQCLRGVREGGIVSEAKPRSWNLRGARLFR